MPDQRKPTFDTNPSKPKLRLPPGAWDTHCHVFGPKGQFPFAPTSKIDPADAAKEQLFALHAMLGITLAPVTGALVADVLGGDAPPDIAPFAPGRFRRLRDVIGS